MSARFDYGTAAPGVYDAMDAVDRYLAQSSIDSTLLLLIQLRASQVNGCAYCLNMHWRDLRNNGESEQSIAARLTPSAACDVSPGVAEQPATR